MTEITRACDVENIADFSRYYVNSYVGWHPTDSVHVAPALVGSLITHDSVSIKFLSREGREFVLLPPTRATWKELLASIDFGVPDIGMFPSGPTLSYQGYFSPRAAKKGFRHRETSYTEFNSWAIRRNYGNTPNDPCQKIWHAFNPEYESLEKGLKLLNDGEKVGVPLNRIMGIYTIPKYKYPVFAYKRWSIGHVENDNTIHVKSVFEHYVYEIEHRLGAKVVVG